MFPFFLLTVLGGIGYLAYSKSAAASPGGGSGSGSGGAGAKDTEALKAARRGWLGTTAEEVYQPPPGSTWTKTAPTQEWLASLDAIEKLVATSKDPVPAPTFVLRNAGIGGGGGAVNMGGSGIVKAVQREAGVRFWEVQYTAPASAPFVIKPGDMAPTMLSPSAVTPPDAGAIFFLIDDNFPTPNPYS